MRRIDNQHLNRDLLRWVLQGGFCIMYLNKPPSPSFSLVHFRGSISVPRGFLSTLFDPK